jgi:hypothetical protein
VISEDRLQKALAYLSTTDEPAAELKAQVARKEYLCKRIRARKFLLANGGSVESKKAVAEDSAEVAEAENELGQAIVAFEKVKAKRATEELIVEVWRSVNANRRAGNV